ncbi:putative ribonuclease H-like domain-containing protein [Tanacetum coccineum]
MRAKNIEHTTSLIATNDKFIAQIQEKGFAVAALKNELRKLKGNSVNTKFTKPSILGKPVGQPLKNQSVVRQPTAFKSERPRISKPRFASQVDVNNNLLKPVTTHYLPKRRESAPAKPHHMIAPSSSRKNHSPLAHQRLKVKSLMVQMQNIPNNVKRTSSLMSVQHTSRQELDLIDLHPHYSNAEDNSHKVVRLGINPMIQLEPEDLPKDNPKLEIAVLRWPNASASCTKTKMHYIESRAKRSIKISLGQHSITKLVEHHQMEILLEPSSNKLLVGQAQKEKEPKQEYILIPICTTDPSISQGPKDRERDTGIMPIEVDENEASDTSRKDDAATRNLLLILPMHLKNIFLKDSLLSKMLFSHSTCPKLSSMDNTRIFGNAYNDEDVEEEVDMDNVNSCKKTNEEPANEGERNGQEKEGGASNKEGNQNVQDLRVELYNLLVQQKQGYANSTNRVSTVSLSVGVAGKSFINADDLPTDPLMPDLEHTADLLNTGIFSVAYDDEDVGAEADLNNLETTINVSPIPTTRIHKDHLKDQIIGDINSATQTRRMTKFSGRTCYEPKKVTQALTDLSRIEKQARWCTRLTQEEGIDYDEVFAPVARIEAIRLFLAYASFMRFIVYQMDVKSAFLYGIIEEEVYVCQPPSFEDPQFPDKVYKNQEVLDELYRGAYFLLRVADNKHSNWTNKALLHGEDVEDVEVPSTLRDSYEKKLIQVIKIHTDHNVADLVTKAFDVSRFTFCVDRLDYLIFEFVCGETQKPRKAKRTTEISQSSRPIPFVIDETVIKEWEGRMERDATTTSSLEAEQDSGNINRTQSMATLNESFPQGTDLGSGPSTSSVIMRLDGNPTIYITYIEQFWTSAKAKTVNKERQIQALEYKKKNLEDWVKILHKSLHSIKLIFHPNGNFLPIPYYNALLLRLHPGMNLVALWHLLSSVLPQTKNLTFPGKGFSESHTLFETMMVQATKDMGEDSAALTDSHSIPIHTQPSLSKPQKTKSRRKQRKDSALEIKSLKRRVKEFGKEKEVDASKQGKEINDLDVVAEVSLGDETNQFSTTTIMSWTLAPALIVIKTELEEEERISRLKEEKANIALLELWDNTQAIIDANFQLAQQMQTEEQEHLSIKEKSTLFVELLENRKKHFAALRAQEKRIKPPTKVQKINTMSTYLKNMAGYKHNQLKSKSYDEIRICFDKEMKRVNTFVDINTAFVKSSKTRTEGSSKRAGDELGSDNSKKQKIDKHVEAKKDDDQEEAEMKKHIEIVKDDEVAIDAIPLATKPLVIVKYKIVKEGKFVYFQLIRADGSSKRYLSMIKMLPNINRETWRPSGSWLKLNMGIQGQG